MSFNRITVDGDTSTNDTILLLASGRAGNPVIAEAGPAMAALGEGLNQVHGRSGPPGGGRRRRGPARLPGGGRGRGQPAEALKAARTVALSPLVKTAMAGEDVNWGRIMAALGRSGARFDPEQVEIAFGDILVVQQGRGLGPEAEAQAQKVIQAGDFQPDHRPERRGLSPTTTTPATTPRTISASTPVTGVEETRNNFHHQGAKNFLVYIINSPGRGPVLSSFPDFSLGTS